MNHHKKQKTFCGDSLNMFFLKLAFNAFFGKRPFHVFSPKTLFYPADITLEELSTEKPSQGVHNIWI